MQVPVQVATHAAGGLPDGVERRSGDAERIASCQRRNIVCSKVLHVLVRVIIPPPRLGGLLVRLEKQNLLWPFPCHGDVARDVDSRKHGVTRHHEHMVPPFFQSFDVLPGVLPHPAGEGDETDEVQLLLGASSRVQRVFHCGSAERFHGKRNHSHALLCELRAGILIPGRGPQRFLGAARSDDFGRALAKNVVRSSRGPDDGAHPLKLAAEVVPPDDLQVRCLRLPIQSDSFGHDGPVLRLWQAARRLLAFAPLRRTLLDRPAHRLQRGCF
mmetsp:Transcript_4844/g.19379  ORF Transcript_4844/g.19379 Transcript_4844/m.19379 type:complete len:271 (+) Transcript_4844:1851-2663(+)|eukprot:scaffold1954_cov268-Pinguiococcus_pyrenoidosus.AAC.147